MFKTYEQYLTSSMWRLNKILAKDVWETECDICGNKRIEWHHYKGYDQIWTLDDWRNIVPLCRFHHKSCHQTVFGKRIVLQKEALHKQYKFVKRFKFLYIPITEVFRF